VELARWSASAIDPACVWRFLTATTRSRLTVHLASGALPRTSNVDIPVKANSPVTAAADADIQTGL
jgi:hypothetical protein